MHSMRQPVAIGTAGEGVTKSAVFKDGVLPSANSDGYTLFAMYHASWLLNAE